jgi:hypothetical protein
MRRSSAWAASAVVLAAAFLDLAEAGAQQRSLTGGRPAPAGSDAFLQRQIRTLERAASSPGSADILLPRTQRSLTTQSRGVFLTPEQARLQRDLDRVGRDLQRPRTDAAAAQLPARPRGERLPGTIDDAAALPSFGGTATLTRLVGRAETALAEGRTRQARSDLATARSLVAAVDPGSPEDGGAIRALQGRIAAVERQLADGP